VAARRNTPATPTTKVAEALDFDALLEPNTDDLVTNTADDVLPAETPVKVEDPETENVETPEQARIRELRATLARPATYKAPVNKILTPEQQEIRDLEDQVARKLAAEEENAPVEFAEAKGENTILIHVVEDGFLAQGVTWYRGQEIEFDVDGEAYQQTVNKYGNSWLDLRDDIDGQYDKYGTQYFAAGPWRGRKWGDTSLAKSDEERAAIALAAKAELKRRRAAPLSF
jgi:hypothetical protein